MKLSTLLIGLLLIPCSLMSQTYDLLLKGGNVIDPRNGINAPMDVAVSGNKIARVAESISPTDAKMTVDVSGFYVTPGLVDIHVHVYTGTGNKNSYTGDRSVYPDGFTFRSGVTTVVDAGSSGWTNFPDFKNRVIDISKTRVLALLNIVGKGMAGRNNIEQDTSDMDPKATAKRAKEYPDTIVGIKSAHFHGPEWTSVDKAVEAGKLTDLPVMIDFGTFHEARPFQELVLDHLRPGDIYTHGYKRQVPYVDDKHKLLPYLAQARKRGVKFDVGHGGGSFSWKNAVPAIRQGFWPDSISTDLHIGSMNAGMKDMTNVMSKILSQGVPLYDVIKMSTWNPAQQMKRSGLGHLSEGAVADIAVLRLDHGRFGLVDAQRARLMATKLLVCEMTIRDGQVAWDLNGRTATDYREAYGLM
ncbi:MAG: amidohydrolase/deacetylase family metallohydrolase [Bryobacterales bacterium]|nr:amidohydrolase/deacetylase family metallohydrolase [Bryobacterales bacterium]MDE0295391.1 amidohydrolase/deacetylase family metallohydrolase [Bryobacterales bacterium]MDE0434091.1 amidohydrolase/deacetylase family metallohydrolase [Bryobacterales bacterium]